MAQKGQGKSPPAADNIIRTWINEMTPVGLFQGFDPAVIGQLIQQLTGGGGGGQGVVPPLNQPLQQADPNNPGQLITPPGAFIPPGAQQQRGILPK